MNLTRSGAVAVIAAAFSLAVCANSAFGQIRITEWMYSQVAGTGEYFELTNVGTSPIDMTGWSEDDNNRIPGKHALGAFGVVQPGESVLGTEGSDVTGFRTYWHLPATVKVIAYGTSDNLGRADEINIYDAANALVDRLTFDDQTIGGPRTQGTSANIPLNQLGLNHANLAVASSVPDSYLSYRGDGGTVGQDIGNPGIYTPYQVPEPSSFALGTLGVAALVGLARRKRRGSH